MTPKNSETVDEATAPKKPARDNAPLASVTETLRACNRVNAALKEDGRRLGLGKKSSLRRLDQARSSDPAQFSYWAELEFREFVRRRIEEGKTVAGSDMIASGALLLGLSTETTKRYLKKLRASGGPFSGLGDIVTLNPRYVPPSLSEYWLEDEDDAD